VSDLGSYWTQRDAVRAYTRLADLCEALFAATGELVPQVEATASKAVLAATSRHLGAHAAAWADLVPESVLLADARAAARALGAGTVDGLTPAELFDRLTADLEELLARSAPLADGAARRLARNVLDDVRDARVALGSGWQPPRSGYR
jgi:hypothetical protein